jgi:hypothetical protein
VSNTRWYFLGTVMGMENVFPILGARGAACQGRRRNGMLATP